MNKSTVNVKMKLIETYSFKELLENYFLEDEFRVVDNLTRYTLGGDKLPKNCSNIKTALNKYIDEKTPYEKIKNSDELLIFPVYVNMHGDMVLSLRKYKDYWDSGLAGFVIVHNFHPYDPDEENKIKSLIQNAIMQFNEKYANWSISVEVIYSSKDKNRFYGEHLTPDIHYFGPEPYDIEEQVKILKETYYWNNIKRLLGKENENKLKKLINWKTLY